MISGDVAHYSTPDEYEVAFELMDGLVKRFGLDPGRVVVVPGNHDLNWELSEEAYPFVPKRKLPDSLPEGRRNRMAPGQPMRAGATRTIRCRGIRLS